MTAKQLAAAQKRRAALVDREFRATARGIGVSAIKFCKDRLTATIYAIPVDVGKSGKPKWRRRGHLRRSEKPEYPNPFEVVIVNRAVYAKARHEYGRPETDEQRAAREKKGKKLRSFNPARVSHWRDDLLKTFRPLIPELYHQTVLAILKKQ